MTTKKARKIRRRRKHKLEGLRAGVARTLTDIILNRSQSEYLAVEVRDLAQKYKRVNRLVQKARKHQYNYPSRKMKTS